MKVKEALQHHITGSIERGEKEVIEGIPETMEARQRRIAKLFGRQIDKAGLAELYALEVKITDHYEAGFLTVKDFGKIDVRIMEKIARFDCI
jgi:hypothetical protein